MNLLNLLKAARRDARHLSAADRDARRRRRPALDHLERREVYTAGLTTPFIGPVLPAHAAAPAAQVAPAANPQVVTATTPQTSQSPAFGLTWRGYFDPKLGNGQYRLDVQDTQGNDEVLVQDDGGEISFHDQATGKTLPGPVFSGANGIDSTKVAVRTFANSMGSRGGDIFVAAYSENAKNTTFSATPRTTSTSLASPTGPINLTYDYNCVSNSGTVTVHDIGAGKNPVNFIMSAVPEDTDESHYDSPTADPVQGIQFSASGGGSDQYVAELDVFENGEADATIKVAIDTTGVAKGQSGYTFTQSGKL